MDLNISGEKRFRCACCERRLPVSRSSSAQLVNRFNQREPLCVSCEKFLSMGLPFLTEKIKSKKLNLLKPSPGLANPETSPPEMTLDTPINHESNLSTAHPASHPRRRPASATEYEAFCYFSLSIERFIDGFVRGLGARSRSGLPWNDVAEGAVGRLLGIRQALAKQREDTRHISRTDLRRMKRHLKETELMVEEYALAVVEAVDHGDTSSNRG
jgi:hypothetical protein